MEYINLEDFINNRKKCTIQFDGKSWTFQEPTIEEFLSIKGESDAVRLANTMIIEGDPKEFDMVTNKLSIESKNDLYKQILTKLGLIGRLQKE